MGGRLRFSTLLAAVAIAVAGAWPAVAAVDFPAAGNLLPGPARPGAADRVLPPPPDHYRPAEAGLASDLARLARIAAAKRVSLADGNPPGPLTATPGLITRQDWSGTQVAVTVRTIPGAEAGVAEEIADAGGRALNSVVGVVEAYVPAARLSVVAAVPGVRSVRPIRRSAARALTSTGVSLHGATTWQAAGVTGAGVKIGIIDTSFAGLTQRLGVELPASVQARCYADVGTFSSDLADCEAGDDDHGTAVAETIFDMAPGATYYIANPVSQLDDRQAIAWMTANGVRIINASWGPWYLFDGPGDGTSPYADSGYAEVDLAVAGGALWVASAGNFGLGGWSGSWADADRDGYLDWSPGESLNGISLAAGETVAAAIRWDEPWGSARSDYDLYLFDETTDTPVAAADDLQAGEGDPFEVISYRTATAGTYYLAVYRNEGAADHRIQLLADADLEHAVPDGTLASPADSANPGMLTVGAVKATSAGTIEPYSSRGPTTDGRVKPDLVAADCAATSVEDPFCGTSQAAPYVAGAAALALQASPDLDPAGLAGFLTSRAIPLGSAVPNSTFGAGRLAMGDPPPRDPAVIDLTASPATIARGGTIRLSARLVTGGLPREVTFEVAAADGTWTSLGKAVSGTDETAVLATSPIRHLSVRAHALPAGGLPEAVSAPVRLIVRQVVSLTATPAGSTLRPGTPVIYRATVSPVFPAEGILPRVTFLVYQRSGEGWRLRTQATVRADAAGRATFRRSWPRGEWYVRARANATVANAAALSAVRRATVR